MSIVLTQMANDETLRGGCRNSLLPNRVLLVRRVDDAQTAHQADDDADEHDHESHARARRHADARGGNQESDQRDNNPYKRHRYVLLMQLLDRSRIVRVAAENW